MIARLRDLVRRDIPGRWLAVWLLAACAAVVAIYLSSGMDSEAWDDALFFKRIGLHILQHGTAAWNLEDGPVYGNTSQSFQLVALIPLLLDADHYLAMVKVMSALAMILLFALYLRAARRAGETAADAAVAGAAGLLAACAPYLLILIHSGMETSVALVVLAVNLVVIRAAPATRAGAAAVVGTTLAVFLTRPDAVAISLVVLAGYAWGQGGRPPWRLLLACGAGLAAILGLLWLYFGTPVPLAFYLKSRALTSYTTDFVELSLALKRRNLVGLLVLAAPLLYLAGHGRGAWPRSLVASFALFTAYHYFSTIEVMGWFARFYAPGLVPLALAAIAAAPEARRRARWGVSLLFCGVYLAGLLYLFDHRLIFAATDRGIARIQLSLYLGYAIGWSVLLLGARVHAGAAAALVAIPLTAFALRGLPPVSLEFPPDRPLIERYMKGVTTVRGIHAVEACIREPFRIYHTEIGVPGVLFPRSTITDMAGLMDQQIALQGMDFDARCRRDRPEAIFLPHRNYKSLREQIARGTCLRGYRRVVRDSNSPLYIRKDLAPDFLACAARLGDRWVR